MFLFCLVFAVRPHKKTKIGFPDTLLPSEGFKYCRML